MMPKFDHPLHTSRHSPDSVIDPLELIERAREVGLDGVVITEHDYQWEAEELADLAARAGGRRCCAGAAGAALEGHCRGDGLPSLEETPAGITVVDLVAVVKRHGAAIVEVHPFR